MIQNSKKEQKKEAETDVEKLKKQLETEQKELATKTKQVSVFICFPHVKNRLKRVKVSRTIVAADSRLNSITVETQAAGFIHQVCLYINKYSVCSII